MATARHSIVSLAITSYYHCTSRCVRGAFLCGKNKKTGTNYKHRKRWLEKRLVKLADIFAIQLCSYAIMDNHFHVVMHVDTNAARNWSNREVVSRWHRLFNGTKLSEQYINGEALSEANTVEINQLIKIWRHRLYDIGWFMRCVKEPVARRANAEDGCKGHFWEGRYHSQALLDNRALVTCMAYVDLNPLRARICAKPENANFTSLSSRIRDAQKLPARNSGVQRALIPCADELATQSTVHLPFGLGEYLLLTDWAARQIRLDGAGKLALETPSIIERCNIQPSLWLTAATDFGKIFSTMAGSVSSVAEACLKLGKKCTPGMANCQHYFGT